jgi:hypothetical protein
MLEIIMWDSSGSESIEISVKDQTTLIPSAPSASLNNRVGPA